MAENVEMNGTSRHVGDVPLQDVNSTAGAGDKDQLITDDAATHGVDIPSSPGDIIKTAVTLQLEGEEAEKSRKKTQEGQKIIVISSVTFAVAVTVALILTFFLWPPAVPPHGAVACDVQECSDIGVAVMKQGGGAVDAAVATLLCMGVVNPHHSGIGGGTFLIVRQHGKNTSTVINARETAPSSAQRHMFDNNPYAIFRGPLSAGVPGELRGLQAVHNLYGQLSWSEVVSPAAKLAREGFNVTQSLAHAIQYIDPDVDADLRDIFYRDEAPLLEGDELVREDIAAVLDDLATDGVDAFYEKYGPEMVDATQGAITLADILGYTALQNDTLIGSFNNMSVETMPAPGGGPLLLFILNVLQGYKMTAINRTDPIYYHRLIETLKFMEAHRPMFGDPLFDPDSDNATTFVTSMEHADHIRSLITDEQTHEEQYYHQTGSPMSDHGTAHVSVIGPNEDFVSATSSVNQYFGSRLVTSSGIILNNVMGDFDLPPSDGSPSTGKNYIEPGKCPRSSMVPTIVHQFGKPCASRAALGGINGTRIISGVAEVIIHMLVFGESLTESIESARINDPLSPDFIEYDKNLSPAILDSLRDMGHANIYYYNLGVNLVHAVGKINETVLAHADSREGGSGSAIY